MRPLFLLGEINSDSAYYFYDWIVENAFQFIGHPELVISSPGGDVGLVIGMYDQIIQRDVPTVAMGVVQSAAAVLFLAGAKRSMYPNSMLMFHEPTREKDSEDMSDPDWYLFTKLVAMVRQRTGMDLIEAHDLFDGKFISAERAYELGLCDEIVNLGGTDGRTSRVSESQGQDSGASISANQSTIEPGFGKAD
jgi:ATP-dependent protease ClpP protease subunit